MPSSRTSLPKSAPKLRVALGRSRALTWLFLGLHGGGGAIVWTLPVDLIVRAGLLAAVAGGLYAALRDHAWRRSIGAIVELEMDTEDECAVRQRGSDHWQECRMSAAWVHPTLVVLRLTGERGGRFNLVVARDAVPAEAFRRLRVRLRLRTAVA